MSIKMFTKVTDQIDTQIFWHSWIGNTSLLHVTVITHLGRIDVEKQRLSAGQWVLCWKSSTQWTVSFWVSASKILPWFDTAYWRSLGWTEWQTMQPLNLHSLYQSDGLYSSLYSDQVPEEQVLFSAGSHNWIPNVMGAVWPKTDAFQTNGILLLSEYVGKIQASRSQVTILVPTTRDTNLLMFIRMDSHKQQTVKK